MIHGYTKPPTFYPPKSIFFHVFGVVIVTVIVDSGIVGKIKHQIGR